MNRRLPMLLGASALWLLLLALALPRTHVSADSSAKARGAELFATKGCAHCHGPAGVGGGLGPDLQLLHKRMDNAAVTHQIHDGGKAMPAFGDQLSDAEIADLVAFLSAKRKTIVLPPPPPPPAIQSIDPPQG